MRLLKTMNLTSLELDLFNSTSVRQPDTLGSEGCWWNCNYGHFDSKLTERTALTAWCIVYERPAANFSSSCAYLSTLPPCPTSGHMLHSRWLFGEAASSNIPCLGASEAQSLALVSSELNGDRHTSVAVTLRNAAWLRLVCTGDWQPCVRSIQTSHGASFRLRSTFWGRAGQVPPRGAPK